MGQTIPCYITEHEECSKRYTVQREIFARQKLSWFAWSNTRLWKFLPPKNCCRRVEEAEHIFCDEWSTHLLSTQLRWILGVRLLPLAWELFGNSESTAFISGIAYYHFEVEIHGEFPGRVAIPCMKLQEVWSPCCKIKNHERSFLVCLMVICKNLCSWKYPD